MGMGRRLDDLSKTSRIGICALLLCGAFGTPKVSASASGASTRILFHDGYPGGDLYSITPDGASVRRLTKTDASEYSARWSPDRKLIVVTRTPRGGDSELVLLDPDGDRVRKLTNNQVADGHADWAPNGRRLVFTRNRNHPDLFIMRRDGRIVRRLTNDPESEYARWSPDGEWIAFTSRRGRDQIYLIRPDGSDRHRLTHEGSNRVPSWAPGSNRIVFEHIIDDDVYGLRIMRIDGTGSHSLGRTYDVSPVWSPNGRRIAYSRSEIDGDYVGVSTMRIDGTGRRRLRTQPSWAEDW